MAKKYDYLIVGAGLFGSVFTYEMSKLGKKCIVIDRRNHIAGNTYTENIENINVHKYGAHIFHTSNKKIWDYMNQFCVFNNYINSPIANYRGEIYNMPFNMNTFNRLWGVVTPDEAKDKIEQQKSTYKNQNIENLEDQAISLVGTDIYEKLIKGYTEKQWGKSCRELPSFIIKRVPVRFKYDNNYFDDIYQGIPIGGYTKLVQKLIANADIKLNTDYLKNKIEYSRLSNKIVYTGAIDEYFDYKFGELEYRALEFKTEILESENYQGNAVVNYTDSAVPFTRIIEHKHFEFGKQHKTVITYEYPVKWQKGVERYYPVNDKKNQSLYLKYMNLANHEKNTIFGGRLAEYRYYDMDKVVESALKAVELEVKDEYKNTCSNS